MPLSRRRFLRRSIDLGTAAATRAPLTRLLTTAGVAGFGLASCGSERAAPTVVQLYSGDHVLVAGRPQRIPFALVTPSADDGDVALPADDESLAVRVLKDGETVVETSVRGHIVDHDHPGGDDPDHQHANLFRYYPLRAELPDPGIYDIEVTVDGARATLAVQMFAEDRARAPLTGQPFPPVATPTFDRPEGVDRLCTRFEPCPFHAESADDIMADGRPLALLVATPAFCSTAYCGPVLDTLIEAVELTGAADRIGVVHTEVYANTDEVEGNYADPRIRPAPALVDIGIEFEPSLFLVDGGGVIVDRIDNVFDVDEAAEALTALMA